MQSPPLVPVLVSTAALFILGWLWYSPLLFFKPWMRLRGKDPVAAMAGAKMPGGKLVIELIRCFALSYLLAHLALGLELHGVGRAVHAGLFFWVTFPVILFTGAVLWDEMPWQLAAIHAGDWLVKLLVVPVILVVMQ